MNLRQTRIIAYLVLALGVAGLTIGRLFVTPRAFISSAYYFIGIAIFTCVGAFAYLSTSDRISKLTSFALIAGGLALVTASQRFPQTLEIAAGVPAIFIGAGLRVAYMTFRKK